MELLANGTGGESSSSGPTWWSNAAPCAGSSRARSNARGRGPARRSRARSENRRRDPRGQRAERVLGAAPTRHLVGADGSRSVVAEAFGARPQRTVPIVQARVALGDRYDPDVTRIWFDRARTRFFYWLIPESKTSGVLGLIAERPSSARPLLEAFMKEHGYRAEEYQGAMIPLHQPRRPIEWRAGEGRVLLVGDAAAHVKVTTVGGVVRHLGCAGRRKGSRAATPTGGSCVRFTASSIFTTSCGGSWTAFHGRQRFALATPESGARSAAEHQRSGQHGVEGRIARSRTASTLPSRHGRVPPRGPLIETKLLDLAKTRILVTGGSGFLGSHVVEELDQREIPSDHVLVPRSADYDLVREDSVARLFRDTRPDVVVHLAAVVGESARIAPVPESSSTRIS